jgi:Mg-chelatase subunit ChlD
LQKIIPPVPSIESTLTRFRLILGADEADGTEVQLEGVEQQMDAALGALYEFERKQSFDYGAANEKKGGLGASQPGIARWLGDIRKYFPQQVVQVIQHDALNEPALGRRLMLEPEILEQAVPDVHLVATLLELGKLIPAKTKDTARRVVRKVVDELLEKLEQKTIAALSGALHRSARTRRPRLHEMNWHATILKNLKHYQPEYQSIIPETRIGYGRKNRRSLKDIVLCLDQSGSMGTSVVYSGIFGAVLASVPGIKTRMIAFDTEVADLSEELKDPVELLFGVQLGGGTDIAQALGYCQGVIERPDDTILVLITDLYEGGDARAMRRRMAELAAAGVQVIVLLALSDDGAPAYDPQHAQYLASLHIPVFACTPDLFPDMMAAAVSGRDMGQWAGENGVVMRG